MILALLALGTLGTGAELILLRHFEDAKQAIPLALVGMGLAALLWNGIHPCRTGVLALRYVMILFVIGGLAGLVFHYLGNREFQLELDPSLGGAALFMKVMRAKAPPALAPGVLTQLGLLGLAYAYRHPALAEPPFKTERTTGTRNE